MDAVAVVLASGVEGLEFGCGVPVVGVRARVPGAGHGPGTGGSSWACLWCAVASIK